ncbi:hypothetical protein GCM10023238_29920 [Streptomyces heliomycini]
MRGRKTNAGATITGPPARTPRTARAPVSRNRVLRAVAAGLSVRDGLWASAGRRAVWSASVGCEVPVTRKANGSDYRVPRALLFRPGLPARRENECPGGARIAGGGRRPRLRQRSVGRESSSVS